VGARSEELLDSPFDRAQSDASFLEKVRRRDVVSGQLVSLASLLERTHDSKGRSTATTLEVAGYLLAERLAELWAKEARAIGLVPAARASTRREIVRRLEVAREVIHGSLDRDLSLQAVARLACLSPHHFHRMFRSVYGETLHRYVANQRLQRAAHLLETTSWPVRRICRSVGFTSVGSFGTLFARNFGSAPLAYRGEAARRGGALRKSQE
jgi:AraC family transcriptional regulator